MTSTLLASTNWLSHKNGGIPLSGPSKRALQAMLALLFLVSDILPLEAILQSDIYDS